jgi:hypothetical protein
MVLASGLLLAVMVPARAADLFVDQATGDDANDGLSWATARATVTSALETAGTSPEPDVISVAEGSYREWLFVPADTALLGGFPSGGGARDRDGHPTVLQAPAVSSIAVVTFEPGSDRTMLDGFVIRGGTSGVSVTNAAPVIRGNRIEENYGCYGGGLYVAYSEARPVALVEGNLIQRNSTERCFGRYCGGGVFVGAAPGLDLGLVLSGNVVTENHSPGSPAVCIDGSTRLEHNVITHNDDGGLATAGGSVTLFNDLILGNARSGLSLRCSGPCRVENVTVTDNGLRPIVTCEAGGSVELVSSIVWAHDADGLSFDCPGSEANVRDSLIQGGFPGGVRILDADPLFVPGPLGDAYLSQPPVQAATSPAVDTGAVPATTAGLDTRTTSADSAPDAGVVDMGFHWRALAALTILRGTRADALAAHRTVTALPFTDDPGTLTDPALPLLFYRVAEATNEIGVQRDEGADAVRLELLGAP